MKFTKYLPVIALLPATAHAHTGDHSSISSSLAHVFSYSDHYVEAFMFVALVVATLALAGVKAKLQARRAK